MNTILCFRFFDKFLPTVLINIVNEFTFYRCKDCNILTIGYNCSCGIIRCEIHSFLHSDDGKCIVCMNSVKISEKKFVKAIPKCIIKKCSEYTTFGTEKEVLYCFEHALGKKVVYYGICEIYKCPCRTTMCTDWFGNPLNYYPSKFCIHHTNERQHVNYIDFTRISKRRVQNIIQEKEKRICMDCQSLSEVYYCSCNIIRCLKCHRANAWIDDIYKNIKCDVCYEDYYKE